MRYLSDDDLLRLKSWWSFKIKIILILIYSLYHDIVFQVTFIPTSPPMEETRARDFFQERHFSIGWVALGDFIIYWVMGGWLITNARALMTYACLHGNKSQIGLNDEKWHWPKFIWKKATKNHFFFKISKHPPIGNMRHRHPLSLIKMVWSLRIKSFCASL